MTSVLIANSARWRKSTLCGGSATCVAIAPRSGGGAAIRNTADPTQTTLLLTDAALRALFTAIKEAS